MPIVRCDAIFCIHNDYKNKRCDVTNDTIVDMRVKGMFVECFDYSPVTNVEYKLCTGIDRGKDLGGKDLEN